MGKEEKMLQEILERITTLEDKIESLNFTVVQLAGDGAVSPKEPSSGRPSRTAEKMEIDLKPLENKLDSITSKISTSASDDKLEQIEQDIHALRSGKVKKADELIDRATLLLEQGLKLTELETSLLEIRDQLEQIIVELSTKTQDMPT